MESKQKAIELVEKYTNVRWDIDPDTSKQCALIAVENEYNSLREMLFNLRSCHVIESGKVYIHRLLELIDEEQQVKAEIEKL